MGIKLIKKNEARPTKQASQIKELCNMCRKDKQAADAVFKALTRDYNTSLDPVLAGQYLTRTWQAKLKELGGCNGWYDGFKKLYADMGVDFICSVLQDMKLGASEIGSGACTSIVQDIYTKLTKKAKSEARMHLGRCKNCGGGWTKTSYLDELESDVRKYFKEKGFADNADICPKCVAAVKKHLAQGKDEGATYDEYVDAVAASLEDDFEYSPVTALEFARDDFKEITKAFYSATKGPKEAAKEIDAKYMGGNESRKKTEAREGWDGWEEVEGLEDTIEGVENLAYELRSCIRGAKTGCKDWKALGAYIQGLGNNLVEAGEEMVYKTDDADESKKKKKNPSKNFSSTAEEDADGKKKSH